ncbi:MAG: 4Fe-4S dicluster domain-containing protein [Thermodesulfobacteriota bacterium]
MRKWYLVIDVAKCENCNNCFLACKDEHCGNDWPGYSISQPDHGHRWMNILRKERGQYPFVDMAYLPKPCLHCDPAPCMAAVPDGTIFKREDGIVLVDPVKAKGRKEIAEACPYGAIWWNEAQATAQKCTLCAHLLDRGWKKPRCVQACPTGALTIHHIQDSEAREMIRFRRLEILENKKAPTSAQVLYQNLYRFKRVFIAGSVAFGRDSTAECAAGATVELHKKGERIDRKTTDAFGVFKFDGLPENSGDYKIQIRHGDMPAVDLDVVLETSRSLGTIWL